VYHWTPVNATFEMKYLLPLSQGIYKLTHNNGKPFCNLGVRKLICKLVNLMHEIESRLYWTYISCWFWYTCAFSVVAHTFSASKVRLCVAEFLSIGEHFIPTVHGVIYSTASCYCIIPLDRLPVGLGNICRLFCNFLTSNYKIVMLVRLNVSYGFP
jgi:hypothetical protein